MCEDLKEELITAFILPESEIALLKQLKDLQQNSMSVSDYNAKFNQLTMQVDLHPMEEVSYYLDGLRKEIQKAIESNPMNIGNIKALKLAALHQDRIENPQQCKNVVADESAFAKDRTTMTRCRDKGKGKKAKSQTKKKSSMSLLNDGRSKVQCHICSKYGHMSFKCKQVAAFIKQEMGKHKNSNGGNTTKVSSAWSLFASTHLSTSSPLKVQGVATMKSEMELLVDSS